VQYRSLAKRVGNAVRLAEVLQVLVKHGFADLVYRSGLHEGLPAKVLRKLRLIETQSNEPETLGRRVRSVLTELGPTFIKFGQVLSTRPDLIGREMCDELNLLQDRVSPLPFDKIRPVIELALGAPLVDTFEEFDETPVASASLSQVYQAQLRSGERVAVKAQRPGIRQTITSDLALLSSVAGWLKEHVEDLSWLDPPGTVEEFARSIRREIDFTIESRTITRFRDNFSGIPSVFVPRVFQQYSSSTLLIMEWVDGARVDDIGQFAARGCDPKVVAQRGCEILCTQVFEHHLFHADPHPGNILITRDNQIAFLDYGMVGHLERQDVATMADLLASVYREDAHECVHALLHFTTGDEAIDRDALTHQIAEYLAFEAQSIVGGGQVAKAIDDLTSVLRRNHLKLAPRFSLLLKALATIESAGHTLDPHMDMLPIIRPYVEQMVKSRYEPKNIARSVQDDLLTVARLAREVPLELQDLLRLVRSGKATFQVTHEGLENVASVLDRASNRIAFGIITGALIVGSSMLISSESATRGIGITGFIIAGVLGLGLIVSIIRSKNY
jgi:ubiquinone biosynthesis protein